MICDFAPIALLSRQKFPLCITSAGHWASQIASLRPIPPCHVFICPSAYVLSRGLSHLLHSATLFFSAFLDWIVISIDRLLYEWDTGTNYA